MIIANRTYCQLNAATKGLVNNITNDNNCTIRKELGDDENMFIHYLS
jgi:hypothetical protein